MEGVLAGASHTCWVSPAPHQPGPSPFLSQGSTKLQVCAWFCRTHLPLRSFLGGTLPYMRKPLAQLASPALCQHNCSLGVRDSGASLSQ